MKSVMASGKPPSTTSKLDKEMEERKTPTLGKNKSAPFVTEKKESKNTLKPPPSPINKDKSKAGDLKKPKTAVTKDSAKPKAAEKPKTLSLAKKSTSVDKVS